MFFIWLLSQIVVGFSHRDWLIREFKSDLTVHPAFKWTLPRNWSHEVLGADLVLTEIENRKNCKSCGELAKTTFGTIDGGIIPDVLLGETSDLLLKELNVLGVPIRMALLADKHGTAVVNLINAPPPLGLGINQTFNFFKHAKQIENPITLKRTHISSEDIRFLNIAYILDQKVLRNLMKQTDPKVFVVQAAGNNFSSSFYKPNLNLNNLVTVGSLSPTGLPTFNTKETYDVLVPADFWLTSYFEPFKLGRFGETSGASGLLTGGLALLTGFAPELETDHIKEILFQTSIPTLFGRLVNFYKFYMFLQFSHHAKLTGKEAILQFERFCDEYVLGIKMLFHPMGTLFSQEKMHQLIRQAFFLKPADPFFQEKIVEGYHNQKQPLLAHFYENLNQRKAEKFVNFIISNENTNNRSLYFSALRALGFLNLNKLKEAVIILLASDDKENQLAAISLITLLKKDGVRFIVDLVKKDREPTRIPLMQAITKLCGNGVTEIGKNKEIRQFFNYYRKTIFFSEDENESIDLAYSKCFE